MAKRLSSQRLLILSQYRDDPQRQLSGAELLRLTKLVSGTLYPALYALEAAKMLVSNWESGDPATLGRPRKRFYRITPLGQEAYAQQLKELGGPMIAPSYSEGGTR